MLMLYKLIKVRFNFEFFINLFFFIQVFLIILMCYNNGILLAEEVSLDETINEIAKEAAKKTTKENLIEFQKNIIKDTAKEISKKALKEIRLQSKYEMLFVNLTAYIFVDIVVVVLLK